jgi:hypothetical protein
MKPYAILSALTLFSQLAYSENWVSELPKSAIGNPPYMAELTPEQVSNGAVPWTEIKHIDVIKTKDDKVIYMTWIGRAFTGHKDAVDDFIMVNQEINGLKNKRMHDIGNFVRLRFIGDFKKQEVSDIHEKIQLCATQAKLIHYVSGIQILDNGIWHTVQ